MLSPKPTFKKIIFICFLSVALAFAPIHTHKAGAWLEFAGQILRTVLDQIRDLINGIIMGMLKQIAVQSLNKEMGGMIGGSSSQNAKFITDWTDYMYTQPKQTADKFMNDYLSQVTRGRGSMSNYIPNNNASGLLADNYEGVGDGSFAYGMAQNDPAYGRLIQTAQAKGFDLSGVTNNAGNYMQGLVDGAKKQTTEQVEAAITYVGNPAQNLFAGGNFKNLNTYLSGINNPWAFNINAQQKYQEQLAQQIDINRTMGQAYNGFKGTMSGNLITNPGSLIKENMANVQDLGNKVLANAKNMPEVITSVVQQMITQSIQSGIGNAQRNIQREVQNVQNKAAQEINSQAQQYGPQALYGNVQNQLQGAISGAR